MSRFLNALFRRSVFISIVLGVILLVYSWTDAVVSFEEPKSFTDVYYGNVKEGDYIKGEILYTIGIFAKEDTINKNRSGITKILEGTAYYFVVPYGNSVIGLKVNKNDYEEVLKNYNETASYVLEGAVNPTNNPDYEGRVVKMSSELTEYCNEWLADSGLSVNQNIDYYVIVPVNGNVARVFALFGILFILYAFASVISRYVKLTREDSSIISEDDILGNSNKNNYRNSNYRDLTIFKHNNKNNDSDNGENEANNSSYDDIAAYYEDDGNGSDKNIESEYGSIGSAVSDDIFGTMGNGNPEESEYGQEVKDNSQENMYAALYGDTTAKSSYGSTDAEIKSGSAYNKEDIGSSESSYSGTSDNITAGGSIYSSEDNIDEVESSYGTSNEDDKKIISSENKSIAEDEDGLI